MATVTVVARCISDYQVVDKLLEHIKSMSALTSKTLSVILAGGSEMPSSKAAASKEAIEG